MEGGMPKDIAAELKDSPLKGIHRQLYPAMNP
jgi:hypothetical protein